MTRKSILIISACASVAALVGAISVDSTLNMKRVCGVYSAHTPAQYRCDLFLQGGDEAQARAQVSQ